MERTQRTVTLLQTHKPAPLKTTTTATERTNSSGIPKR